MQVEGAKCIITWGTTEAKGRPNRVEMGLGRSAQAGRPSPLRGSVRPLFPCTRRIFNPKALEAPPFAGRERESDSHKEAIHKLEREEGDLWKGVDDLEGSTHKWRRRTTPSEG
jgi:hypothetical protein